MFKSLFLPLFGNQSDELSSALALNIARDFNAHIDCLHIRRDLKQRLLEATIVDASAGVGSGMLVADLVRSFEQSDKTRRESAAKTFKAISASENMVHQTDEIIPEGASCSFREVLGLEDEILVPEARIHDLTLLGYSGARGYANFQFAQDILIGGGRPLLLAARNAHAGQMQHVAIAWKNTPESSRAVAASMPLLKKALRVSIITIAEDNRETSADTADALRRYLGWHGLYPEVFHIGRTGMTLRGTIEQACKESNAQLLVMGGYGHNRMSEFVFGGLTRDVLRDPFLPTLMVH